ncbi:MAG: bifunctional indole-3-glycerol-phosphate synthase TrpC/phosphoribosylanthranilate isomerase TrpF, partial [bacterium]|nr:bifunctional indole-3-glycerol-phosphate synthase TrpC/phosphoribosylanthranilate isomerase TrpF [bacterium]
CRSRHLDLVLVNAALALKLVGHTRNLKKAYQKAMECVVSGKAYAQFLAYKKLSHTPSILLEITAHKRKEVELAKKKLSLRKLMSKVKPSSRDFKAALLRRGLSLIAEVKQASPSTGQISKKKINPARVAQIYERSGARAISVLTDRKYFKGSLEHLRRVEAATRHTPLLRKDFIVDEYQIYEARHFGADAILLIAAILSTDEMKRFIGVARSLDMDCLCEIHTEEEVRSVVEAGAEIIGINNRNLHTFSIDLNTTKKLAKLIPKGKIIVAESGIESRNDIRKLPPSINAVLIGTSLMKSKNPEKKIHSLMGNTMPLVKICGVQSTKEAFRCQELGVDFIGLNFVPSSRRRISYQTAESIIKALGKRSGPTKTVGVFMDQPEDEIFPIAEQLGLDFVQLHGSEPLEMVRRSPLPVIKAFSVTGQKDLKRAEKYFPHVAYLLLDGRQPGSGDAFPYKLLRNFKRPFLLAGGINKTNAKQALKNTGAIGIDCASGVETNWRRDLKKMTELINLFST